MRQRPGQARREQLRSPANRPQKLKSPPHGTRMPAGKILRMVCPLTPGLAASPEVLNRLWTIIDSRNGVNAAVSHSARLLAKGTPQLVQKLGEELIECLIEAMAGNHAGLVAESADVLYHLLVTWVNAGIQPEEVWTELTRREEVSRLSEDIPLKRLRDDVHVGTSKIPYP